MKVCVTRTNNASLARASRLLWLPYVRREWPRCIRQTSLARYILIHLFSGGLKSTGTVVRAKSARTTKPPSRTEAGPSSKPTKGRKDVPQLTTDISDIEELTAPSGPFDFATVDADNDEPTQKMQSQNADPVPAANGKTTAKGKGKAKAPQTKSAVRKPVDDPMDVDPIEVPDETEEEPGPRRQGMAKPDSRLKPTKARRKEADEIARLTEQLRRVRFICSRITLRWSVTICHRHKSKLQRSLHS